MFILVLFSPEPHGCLSVIITSSALLLSLQFAVYEKRQVKPSSVFSMFILGNNDPNHLCVQRTAVRLA